MPGARPFVLCPHGEPADAPPGRGLAFAGAARTRREIDAAYDKYFRDERHIEDYWLQSRLVGLKKAAALLPASAQRLVVRKLAGMIFVARKPA